MAAPTRSGSLDVSVSDFGPIARANIALRPLTVFVGPSNTGKSWLAVLIYALHRYFSAGVSDRPHEPYVATPLRFAGNMKELSAVGVNELRDVVLQLRRKQAGESLRLTVSPELVNWIKAGIGGRAGAVQDRILRALGLSDTKALVRRKGTGSAGVRLRKHSPEATSPLEHVLTLGKTADLAVTIPEHIWMSRDLVVDVQEVWPEVVPDKSVQVPLELLVQAISILNLLLTPRVIGPLHHRAHYLPAARTGLMDVHRLIVNASLEIATKPSSIAGPNGPMLSGVLSDFLQTLQGINPVAERLDDSAPSVGRQIETKILGGSVEIVKPTVAGSADFKFRPDGWVDSLFPMNASSMVSDLAPIVLYLRYVVSPGDMVVIEEPESHLHPSQQAALARQLAVLVQNGVRILVTTHSEWILEEFANRVRMSALSSAQREGLPGEGVLAEDAFGAWLFERRNATDGSTVREIRLGVEEGGLDAGFADVATALHNTWAEIGNRQADANNQNRA